MATNNRPLVSVIIPSCNRARTLPRAIESVLTQRYAPIETVVIDNGSSDGTWEAVSPYLSKIRYFFMETGGEVSACNFGLAKARGDLVAFMNPGDVWKDDKIEKQLQKLGEGEYAACITDEEVVDEDGSFLHRSNVRRTITRDGYILKQYLKNMCGGFSSSLLVRKEAVNATGDFNETLETAWDQEYFMRLASRFRVALVHEPLVRATRSREPAGRRSRAENDLIVLDRLARIAPEFVRKNNRLIRKIQSRDNREYAEELLGNRYISEARCRIRESLSQRFTFRALVLYAKSLLMGVLSIRYPQYRDRGCLDGR